VKLEQSFGIIPLKRAKDHWEVLLVQPHKGWWGIPKGHANQKENAKAAAERELFEETGLKLIRYLIAAPLKEHYKFYSGSKLIDKTVTYFIAEVDGEVFLQAEELKGYRWVSLDGAEEYATYAETKAILLKTRELMR
jgi:bis(5'-nucleosidyl)-tetraphosphatase